MTMFLDLDSHEQWLNTEGITFEVSRRSLFAVESEENLRKTPPVAANPNIPNTNIVWPVPIAKRRAIRTAERSPSGGSYTAGELRWLLPGALLGDIIPKPGDVVVDRFGERWTVITPERNRNGATWLLGTLNLAVAHQLDLKVNIERPTISRDAAGAVVKSWPTGTGNLGGGVNLYTDLRASVQLLTEEIVTQRGITGFKGNIALTVEKQILVSYEDRVRLPDGTYLDIRGVRNPQQIQELPVLDCEKRP